MVKKISQVYLEVRKLLLTQEKEQSAGLIARNLLCNAIGCSPEELIAQREQYLSEETCAKTEAAVKRYLNGEPLAYILGEWDFYGMTLYVDNNVLIPRDDTCAVTSLAIEKSRTISDNPRILDLCSGSGCIGLAVANAIQNARVVLGDISRETMAVAKKNIALQKLSSRVSCVCVNALEEPPAFLGKFDLIVSNPPYITTQQMKTLDKSVKDFEPELALHGGTDGLDFYRSIAKNYCNALKNGGYLCFEFGMGQGDAVCKILEDNGYFVMDRTKDYNQIERAVIARYGRKED